MLTLAAAETLRGTAGSNSAITYTIFGLENGTTEDYKILGQGQFTTSVATVYTVPASTATLIKTIDLHNTTAGAVTVSLYANGATAAFRLLTCSIPANGSAIIDGSGLHIYDSTGLLVTTSSLSLTGDVTGSGAGTIATVLATVNSNVGAFGSNTQIPTVTVNAKGLVTAASQAAVLTTPSGQTPVGATRTLTAQLPLRIDAGLSADLSADRLFSINAATTALSGSMSALDKQKLDNVWIDVTANATALVLPGNTAAANITAINAILAAAPSGATVKFPKGRYDFNAAWTMPATNKMFTFVGEGSNRAGSPATAFTELRWTSDVAGTWITLPGSGNGWYTEFKNLTFTSSVAQTAGYVVDANGNVGVNFRDVGFQGSGGTLWGVINYGGGSGSNSANSTVIDNCHMSSFKDVGVRVNASGSSLVISNSVIQGLWGTSTQAAVACVSGGFVGALQINDCDLLGAVNNLLLNPVLANGEVAASVFCTNTYMDNSFGSCLKITGTGATVRCRFDTCSFTTSNAGTGFSAVEIASTFTYAAGGQGLDFVNCNILNTFATTGTTNGFLISGTADFSIGNCRVGGWTNGIQVTPFGTAGVTQLQINNNTIGPSGGYPGNTVGLLLNAGAAAYGAIIIEGNHLAGNTTPLTDNSLATGATITQKNISANTGQTPGVGGIVSLGAIVTTTAEISVARIPIPAASLRVGSTFRYEIVGTTAGTTSIITTRARFGTAGTVADASVCIMSAPAAAVAVNTIFIASGTITIQAIGAGATTARGSGRHTSGSNLVATGNPAITAAFSSTVANFLTISMQNTTSSTTTILGGYLEGCA